MPLTRRRFLATAGSAVIGAAWRPPRAFAARPVTAGVQLYTLRSELALDFDGTLRRVAAIGYRSVELAGRHGRSAAAVRDSLRRHGLVAPSGHVSWGDVTGDWDAALSAARQIGHDFVTLGSLPASARGSLAQWQRAAGVLNQAGRRAAGAGLRFAYHNHDFELTPVENAVPLEVLIAETDPELVSFQLDVYWLTRAGHDPVNWLTLYPQRFVMLHLKDSSGPPDHRMTDVGAGVIDFPAVLAAAAAAGVRHSFVEHDRPADALASIRASYDYLSRLF
jgi:sugar phosphate isomerase/epimerase